MKAVLTWHKIIFTKTHDLDDLKRLCLLVAAELAGYLDKIGDLTKYAWRFRYPGAPYSPDRKEAEQAMRRASELLRAITTNLEAQLK
jgi:hypothetical protein